MNLEGLKKSMKHQEGQRSVKKYIVLFILLVLVVIFIVLKGADIESVWNAMKNADTHITTIIDIPFFSLAFKFAHPLHTIGSSVY